MEINTCNADSDDGIFFLLNHFSTSPTPPTAATVFYIIFNILLFYLIFYRARVCKDGF